MERICNFLKEAGVYYLATATIFDETIVNKTYKYLLTPLVKTEGADSEIEPVVLKPITLSVKVHGNKVSVTTSVKGSIDLVTRDNGIVYTITGGKNFNYHLEDILAEDIKIYGESENLFDIDVLEPNEKGQPQLMVKAKADAELEAVKARQTQLEESTLNQEKLLKDIKDILSKK